MKNIDNIEDLKNVKQLGKVIINGIPEIVTGIFSKNLITYREKDNLIEVRDYNLYQNKIDSELLTFVTSPTKEYFDFKTMIDSFE